MFFKVVRFGKRGPRFSREKKTRGVWRGHHGSGSIRWRGGEWEGGRSREGMACNPRLDMGGDRRKRGSSERERLESNPRKRMEKIGGWQARCCIAWTGPREKESRMALRLLDRKDCAI